MPIAITCASCRFSTNAEERLAGKRVRCPKCREPIAIPETAPVRASASPSRPKANGRPTPAAAAEPIVVECSCGARFKTQAEWAGRTTKCPKCAKPLAIPMPKPVEPEASFETTFEPSAPGEAEPAVFEATPTPKKSKSSENDEWVDVGEAYQEEAVADDDAEDAEPAEDAATGSSSDWGEEHLAEHELPDELHEKIRAELTRGERILWCTRPDEEIVKSQASSMRIIGIVLLVLAVVFLAGSIGSMIPEWPARWILGPFLLIFVAFFVGGGIYTVTMPGRVMKGMAGRACFLITNRRLFVHPGIGTQVQMGFSSKSGLDSKAKNKTNQMSFNAGDLMYVHRVEFAKMPGSGEIHVGRTILDNPTGSNLFAVRDVAEVERKIRELLVHPLVDKLLTGEVRIKDSMGTRSKGASDEELPVEGNLKNALAKQGALPTDGNVKAAKTSAAKDLSKVDSELRERVEAELTAGERILWIGEPEGKTKGRGVLGAVLNSEHRCEPDYELYAITNRRAMLFDGKGSIAGMATQNQISFSGGPKRGPVCYYPGDLFNLGIEDDSRIPSGGSIVFRRAKILVEKRSKERVRERAGSGNSGRRGGGGFKMKEVDKVKITRTVEMHQFGILRIANAKNVARLLFETLVRPCKRA